MTALTPFVATIVRIPSRGRDLSPASQQAWRAARHSARDLMKSCLRRWQVLAMSRSNTICAAEVQAAHAMSIK
jgi:hypothetical protein